MPARVLPRTCSIAANAPGTCGDKPGVKDLTPAERSVLRLIADYKTSSEIGEQLHISPCTVDTHRNNICSKLDLRGKHALAKFAIENRRELE
jgi:DNA-binding CsgD family transcriptional regulator